MPLPLLLPLLGAVLVAHADGAAGPAPLDVGLRFKAMSLPDSVLTTWVFNESTPAQAALPHVGATSVGLEFTIEEPANHWTFYLERFSFHIADGYWDDVEEPPDHNDGNWVAVSKGFGMVTAGANTGQEWAITHKDRQVWLGFGLDGGLGLGVVTGHLTRWYSGANLITDTVADPSCLPDVPAYDRYAICGDDGAVKVFPILPILDFDLGFALHIADHAYLRIEGGLHDLPYYGGAIGAHF